MGLGSAYSLGLSRRAQVAQRETGGLQGKCMRGAVERSREQGAGREVVGISDRSDAKGQEGFREVRD